MRIDLVNCDDWQTLYIDGKLRLSQHSITPAEILLELGIPFGEHECDEESVWASGFPEDFHNVKLIQEQY